MDVNGDHEVGLVGTVKYSNFQDTGMAVIKPGIIPDLENEADLFKGETGDYSFVL